MPLVYRVQPLPAQWPGNQHSRRRPSPFKVNWSSTLRLLETEVRALRGSNVVLRLAVRPQDLRIDGGVKANARIQDPSVILEFKSGPDLLSFPCDRFDWWEDNVRAIALALEALRKVDRYGVRSGRQYEGFKALPSGAAAIVTTPPMTIERACARLHYWSEGTYEPDDIRDVKEIALKAIRYASKIAHPDTPGTGDTAGFQEVQAARAVIVAHHGGSL